MRSRNHKLFLEKFRQEASFGPMRVVIKSNSEPRRHLVKRLLKEEYNERVVYFFLSRYMDGEDFFGLICQGLKWRQRRLLPIRKRLQFLKQSLITKGLSRIVFAFDNYQAIDPEVELLLNQFIFSINNKCVLVSEE